MTTALSAIAAAGTAPLIVSIGAGITVVVAFLALASLRPAPRSLIQRRLESPRAEDLVYEPITVEVLRDQRISSIPLIDRMFRNRRWTANTHDLLERAGVPLRVGEYLAFRAFAVTIGTVLGILIAQRVGGVALAHIFFGFAGALVGFMSLPIFVKSKMRKRQAVIETQLVELCDVMASMLRAGHGYTQALAATAEEVGPPLQFELQRFLDTVNLGGDMEEALDALNERLDSRDFDMIASAISIQRKSGGNLSEILVGVAETIRHRQSFLREVDALTSAQRFAAWIVALFPMGLIAVLTIMAPEIYSRLFTEFAGQMILAAAIAMDLIGFFIIRKLVQIEV